MDKKKYIHTKKKGKSSYRIKITKKLKHKPICIDDFENLAKHESIRNKFSYFYDNYTYISFNNLYNYFQQKIGSRWCDIYSDLIKKTKPKYRHLLDEQISFYKLNMIFYKNGIPYSIKWWRKNNMVINNFYLDKNNILRFFSTKTELLNHVRQLYRQKKLERILNDKKNNTNKSNINNEFDNIFTNNSGEIRFNSRIQWFYNRYGKS